MCDVDTFIQYMWRYDTSYVLYLLTFFPPFRITLLPAILIHCFSSYVGRTSEPNKGLSFVDMNRFRSVSVVGFSFSTLSCHEINSPNWNNIDWPSFLSVIWVIMSEEGTREQVLRTNTNKTRNQQRDHGARPPPTSEWYSYAYAAYEPPSPKLLIPGHPTNRTYSTYWSRQSMC